MSDERDKYSDQGVEDDGPSISRRLEALIPDIVKRTFLTGVGAVLMSEEGIRNLVSDMRLPKEAVGFIIQQADNTKREFFKIIAKEMRERVARDQSMEKGLVAGRIALVSSSRHVYGMTRMYEILIRGAFPAVRTFQELEEATEWLGLPHSILNA